MDQSAAESGRELEVNSGDLSAAVYYSVAESCTHWFIVYPSFTPGAGSRCHGQQHENDVEGLLTIVRKDGSAEGILEGVITAFQKKGAIVIGRNGCAPLAVCCERDLRGRTKPRTLSSSGTVTRSSPQACNICAM